MIERQFFTWEHWDVLDEMSFMFNGVTLTSRVGCFGEGEHFETAIMNFDDEPYLSFQRNNLEWKFPLSLTVGDMIHGPDHN